MENLFSFEYVETPLKNQDGSISNFRQVFGLNGKNVGCPKSSYHIVKTKDISNLGQAFINKGYDVTTFNHRNGETIGLNISFGERPSKVGKSSYNLVITVPNNNSGKGYLAIKQLRLICSNGMMSNKTLHKNNYIKIPHTVNYKESIKLMEQSIEGFTSLLEQVEQRDEMLNKMPLSENDVLFNLNKWFFEQEIPATQKKDMSLDDFRKALVVDPESIKSLDRYNQLKRAYNKELEYNKELGLKLTMYTVYAAVTNYLSRRVEKSNSTASNEIQVERSSKKLVYFDAL